NKESLVVGGELVTALAEATGARLVPVDSEHSALYQLLAGEGPGTVERLALTASGGPFRGRRRDELAGVTVEQALAHPTWPLAGGAGLTCEPVDEAAFPCLSLARAAGRAGGTSPCVLNAANEVAVHAFLDGRLPFPGISEVIEGALERLPPAPVRAFDSLYEA